MSEARISRIQRRTTIGKIRVMSGMQEKGVRTRLLGQETKLKQAKLKGRDLLRRKRN